MRPHTVYVAHVLAIQVTLFAATLIMIHGGLDSYHEFMLLLLFMASDCLTIGAMNAARKEETEGGDE